MIGSEKQIAWANEIKAKIEAEAKPLYGKAECFDRILTLILSIDNAKFWIDYRDRNLRSLLGSLSREGLRIKGLDYSNTIKCDATYTVTETWTEIVSDGKGGHTETKSKTW